MPIELASLVVIAGMAVVTYATRAGGLWVMQRFTPSPLVAACLRHTPGAVLVAIIAPAIVAGGISAALAAAMTVLVAVRSRNVLLAAAFGMATVWALRVAL